MRHPLHHIPVNHRQFLLTAQRVSRAEQGLRGYGHLVTPSRGLLKDDDHFIKDLFEDSNRGQREVLSKRRGPFRNEKGPSRIMSRSANVLIRKRRMQIEVTVKKNVTETEINALHAKLGAHQLTSPHCVVYIVERGIRKRLGTLVELYLDKLITLIRGLLTRGSVGILLIDNHFGGALHRTNVHKGRFTRASYAGDTIHHTGL